MAKRYICLDTDICVDFLRKKEPGFSLFLKVFARFEPVITSITAFELYLGNLKMKRKEPLDDFLEQFVVFPFDHKASKTAAKIQASLEKSGEGIGIPDTLIAGICIANHLPLLTLNTRHFSKVTGLEFIREDK